MAVNCFVSLFPFFFLSLVFFFFFFFFFFVFVVFFLEWVAQLVAALAGFFKQENTMIPTVDNSLHYRGIIGHTLRS